MKPDRRTHFANGSIAHESLRGQVTADRFADGQMRRITTPVANLHAGQGTRALDRQILYGHPICLLDRDTGFARDETSGHVGYLDSAGTGDWQIPTHRVSTRSTLVFDAPDIKCPAPQVLSCGALLRIDSSEGKFARTADGKFALSDHLAPADLVQPDLAATAETLLGTPYLWGGNSCAGIDCSGLLQLAMQAAQYPCPGDSDQQMAQLGTELPPNSTPQRNDLMFWEGHVALVFAPDTLIHANAFHMAVAFEPIDKALERIMAQGDGPLLAHKRL